MRKRIKVAAVGLISALLVLGLASRTKEVKADTTVNSQQGIVVGTTELKTNKTIKSPKSESIGKTIRTSNGKIISRGEDSTGDSIVSYAFNFIGRPYVFGAAGPRAFDCSGLTQYVFAKFGISLPHYTGSQYSMGSSVSKGNLRAGDLVFFNTYGPISHVGIYIGGGDFIHAPSSGKTITVSSLNDSYYAKRYVGARRIAD